LPPASQRRCRRSPPPPLRLLPAAAAAAVQATVGDEAAAGGSEHIKDAVTAVPLNDDEAMLREMGYKQELRRGLSGFANFAVSFTVVSVLTGLTGLYGLGLQYGGPVAVIWGWPLVSFFTMLVALRCGAGVAAWWPARMAGSQTASEAAQTVSAAAAPLACLPPLALPSAHLPCLPARPPARPPACSMAEICSAYPTSGALYFWSAKLAGPRWAPLARCWGALRTPLQLWTSPAGRHAGMPLLLPAQLQA
jgi:hypothetical protein